MTRSTLCFIAVLLMPALAAAAEPQRNTSPEGWETRAADCRPAIGAERADLDLAPDGWVQGTPRDSYRSDEVPLPLVPDWVGTRVRATGALVWFDADHDGDPDLFVGTYWANQYPPLEDYYNFIYLNEGGMLEDDPSWISADQKHTGDAGWGYINDDLYPDLFLANGGTSFQPCQVFYGQDGLLPTTAGWQSIGGNWTTGCALADFDRDGDLDVATTNQGVTPNPYRPVLLFRNTGLGLETSPFWQSNQVGITGACDWGDMDGDLYPELAVSGWSSWETGVFHNLGATLDPDFAWTTGHPERTDKGVGWADADGDGHLDLAVGGSGDPDWLFHNEGTLLGAEPVWASADAYTGCQQLGWVDIDRDGDKDLATIHFSTGHMRIHLNHAGLLSTTADWQYDAASSGSAFAFGDINGDGWMDLAIGVANGPVELFISEGSPAGVEETERDRVRGRDLRLEIGPSLLRDSFALFVRSEQPTTLTRLEVIDAAGRSWASLAPAAGARQRTHAIDGPATGHPSSDLPAGVYMLRASAVDGQGRRWGAEGRIVWLGR